MFPFQSGDLSFQVSNNLENASTTNTNINIINNIEHFLQNVEQTNVSATSTTTTTHLLQPHNAPKPNLKSSKTRKSRPAKTTHDKLNGNNKNEDEICGNDVARKKTIHREVERQRRQEMSNLFSSLRSLLPMEYLRGKRSASDHVTEATNYIKDLENNVKKLAEKRDKLKESFSSLENKPINNRDNLGCSSLNNTTSTSSTTSRSVTSTNIYNVNIHKFSRTLQIEIMTGVGEENQYPLSKSLKVLTQEGLDVVSCVSSKVNQCWIYVIYCEVNDVTSVDSSQLQERLMSVASSCSS